MPDTGGRRIKKELHGKFRRSPKRTLKRALREIQKEYIKNIKKAPAEQLKKAHKTAPEKTIKQPERAHKASKTNTRENVKKDLSFTKFTIFFKNRHFYHKK